MDIVNCRHLSAKTFHIKIKRKTGHNSRGRPKGNILKAQGTRSRISQKM